MCYTIEKTKEGEDLMSGFIIYILVSIFTPGPNNIFSSASCVKVGFRKTLPFMIGVLVGTFIVFYVTGLFNVFLFENIIIISQIIGILGGLFIIYLAIKMFIVRNLENKLMIESDHLFIMAVLLTLINPKALVFGLTVATFYLQLGYDPSGILLLSIISAVLCFISVILWGLFGQLFKQFLTEYKVVFNTVLALLLGYSGVLILIETIQSF